MCVWLGGGSLLQSAGGPPPPAGMWCVFGRPARPLQGPPTLRGKGDRVTEASPFKFICRGRMSAQGAGGLSFSRSNLAFASLSGGARKFGAMRGSPDFISLAYQELWFREVCCLHDVPLRRSKVGACRGMSSGPRCWELLFLLFIIFSQESGCTEGVLIPRSPLWVSPLPWSRTPVL